LGGSFTCCATSNPNLWKKLSDLFEDVSA
jgi:hypothetical protein